MNFKRLSSKLIELSLMIILIITLFISAEELKGTISLSGAWAIYPTAVSWAEAFKQKHPKVTIDVSAGGAGKGAADAIAGLVDIGMVSREPDSAEINKGIIPLYILHDAVFAIINDKNPALARLLENGMPVAAFESLYISGKKVTWGEIAKTSSKTPVHVYTRSDACGAAASWAKFLGNKKQEDLKGVGIYGDPGIIEAVVRDPVGVGYSNLSYVFTRQGALLGGIRLVPIDANNNGKADPVEIFQKRDDAVKAINSATYPATRKNYFFIKKNASPLTKEFIRFTLSDEGVAIVEKVGTSLPLTKVERETVVMGIQ